MLRVLSATPSFNMLPTIVQIGISRIGILLADKYNLMFSIVDTIARRDRRVAPS